MSVDTKNHEEISTDEFITVSPELIQKLRSELMNFFEKVHTFLDQQEVNIEKEKIGQLDKEKELNISKIAVVDGGSNIFSLNVGLVGICVAAGLLFENNILTKRTISRPEIVPKDEKHLSLFSEEKSMRDVLDRLREAKVFELATKMIEKWKPELLLIDGPLIPPGALFPPQGIKKRSNVSQEEIVENYKIEAFIRFKRAVQNVYEKATEFEVSIVGFVKRPHSQILAYTLHNWKNYDHVMLSKVLEVGEFYPDPPMEYPSSLSKNKEFENFIKRLKPRFTYLKTKEQAPPYRIDFGPIFYDYKEILKFLLLNSSSEGIPYFVMKADEETKVGSKLMKEIHDEIIHDYIKRIVKEKKNLKEILAILNIYGG
ncbi:MAG: DNA double-strand break repair nuclease NurA [Candidatus Asgardarchaeia archaeon]